MNRDDIIRMAREADLWMTSEERIAAVERFAALIEANLKEQGYRKCAVGQRTTQFCGLSGAAVQAEREACAKVCEAFGKTLEVDVGDCFAEEIRSRT